MLSFCWFPPKGAFKGSELPGAHLLGADGVPVRGGVRATGERIQCEVRGNEAVALSLLWPVSGGGALQIDTTRLPLREKPYNLHVELARERLMRISMKREEWGLFDYHGMDDLIAEIDQARDLFVRALQHADDPPAAARLADDSLAQSIAASERLSQFHASVFLSRRVQTGGATRQPLGASLPAEAALSPALLERLREFDFVRLPLPWRALQPKEQSGPPTTFDPLIKALSKAGLAVRGGPLVNFGIQSVPDWLYIWENDFEALTDFVREHVRRTVTHFGSNVSAWVFAAGLHADGVFALTVEQIMELTRVAAATARQAVARTPLILEIVQPWGEYFARNPRSVPPLLYAEMAVQSGIPFDAFGLQFIFGVGSDGYFMRDLFQASSQIDRLANLGKPLHITALAAPSNGARELAGMMHDGGAWHGGWSEATQADWLGALAEIAMSKPYVESVCVHQLVDNPDAAVPSGGVLHADGSPKPALARLTQLRKRLCSEGKK